MPRTAVIRPRFPLALALCLLLGGGSAAALVPIPADAVRAELTRVAKRSRAPDAHARLLRVLPLLSALDAAEGRALLDRVKRSSDPLIAARATLAASRYAASPAAARADASEHGFITHWLVAGPVPAPPLDPAGAQTELETAAPPAPEGALEGLGEAVHWHALSDHGPPGATSVDHLLPDDGAAAVHLLTVIEAPQAVDAVLRLGVAGAVSARLGGAWLGSVKGHAHAAADQLAAPVRLEAGPNLLFLTIMRDGPGRSALYARLTDRRGRAIPGLAARAPAAAIELPEVIPADEALTRSAHAPSSEDAPLLAAVARRALGLPDLQGEDDALLEDLLLTDGAIARPAAELLLTLAHVPHEEARASVLQYLRSNHRGDRELILALADLAGEKAQAVRAQQMIDQLQGRTRGELETLVRSRVYRADGQPALAWLALGGRVPAAEEGASERTLLALARCASELGRPDLAAQLYRRLSRGAPADLEYLASLAQALSNLGRPREAIQILESLSEWRPDLPGYLLEAARLALHSGDRDRARALVARAATRVGVNADAIGAVAQLHEELGAADTALDAYRRALALRPGSRQLRARIEHLAPAQEDALPFEREVDAALLATPSAAKEAAYEVLAEEIHQELQPDGTWQRYHQRVVRVHEVPDERDARTTFIRYDPSQEHVRVLAARIHRDGLTFPVLERDLVQIGEAWYGMYYDLRELAVPFDDLRVDDVIEIRWVVDHTGPRALPDTFNLIEVLQDRVHKHEIRLTLTSPAGVEIDSGLVVPEAVRAAGGVLSEKVERLEDGRQRRSVLGRSLPPLALERAMPGAAEVAAIWQATTFQSWAEVARRYRELIEPQRVITPAMRRWVEDKREQARGEEGQVARSVLLRSIVDAITTEIRYVGLEFGIHGYKPYRTDQVWTRRFGDCKDQATLLTSLLGLAGIESRVVLLRTRRQGRVAQPKPSLALFDHAIVWIPEQNLFVDPTARTYGMGELPAQDQGAQVLILDDKESAALQSAPSDTPSRSGIDGRYTVVVHDGGQLGIRGVVTFRGSQAPAYRERLADADARAERLEKLLNGRYPGLKLLGFDLTDPYDRSRPLTLTFEAEVPQVLATGEGMMQVPRPAGGDGLAARWAADDKRSQPLVLGPPASHTFVFRYVLPHGWRARSLPQGDSREGPWGRYQVTWREEPGSAVVVETRVELTVDQIPIAQYEPFRDFLRRFDQVVRPPLVLVPIEASEVGQ